MQITHLLYLLASVHLGKSGAVGPLAREPGQGVGLLLLPPALLQLPSLPPPACCGSGRCYEGRGDLVVVVPCTRNRTRSVPAPAAHPAAAAVPAAGGRRRRRRGRPRSDAPRPRPTAGHGAPAAVADRGAAADARRQGAAAQVPQAAGLQAETDGLRVREAAEVEREGKSLCTCTYCMHSRICYYFLILQRIRT